MELELVEQDTAHGAIDLSWITKYSAPNSTWEGKIRNV